MGTRVSGRAVAVGLLLAGAIASVFLGLLAPRDLVRETRERALQEEREGLRVEARSGAERLSVMLREASGPTPGDVPFVYAVHQARWRSPAVGESSTHPFAEAEAAEFVAKDAEAALVAYRARLAGGDLDPTDKAEGLRNVARLLHARGDDGDAVAALASATDLSGVADDTALLVAYDLARLQADTGAPEELRHALEQGGWEGAAPR